MTTSTPRRGVTIVEILVVTGVIGLLASVLLPALARTRDAGHAVECLSNLRQMTLAARQYGDTYRAWPPAVDYRNDGVFTTVAWDWTTRGAEVTPGALWTFTDDPGHVQQCPGYHGASSTRVPEPFTGYNYNTSYLGDEERWAPDGHGPVRRGVPPSACRRTGTCAMFGDGGRAGGTNKWMRAPLNHERLGLDLLYSGGQAFRHLGATNVAFLDGHVGSRNVPHPGEHATDDLLARTMGFPRNGFLSDDDRAYAPR